jgi:hypothetical protein
MSSEKQIAANRANVRRSTGPNTSGRKARLLSNSILPGKKVLDTIPYHRWLGRSGAIYTVEDEHSSSSAD